MRAPSRIRRLPSVGAALLFAFSAGAAHAEVRATVPAVEPAATAASAPAYKPAVGQPGKDVIWVPTPQALVETMLDMARVTRDDRLVDLGSGDGRLVIAAARRGATALGIEYDARLVELSRQSAQREGVADRASFVKADIFESDFSQATVVTMFLLPDLNLALRPKLLAMRPGTRVVSNSFSMSDWEPDSRVTGDAGGNCHAYCTAYLWIVPAQAAGTWRLPQGELDLWQRFQVIGGHLKTGGRLVPVSGRLRGDRLTFSADGVERVGRVVDGGRIVGEGPAWTATLTGPAGVEPPPWLPPQPVRGAGDE